MTLLNFIKYFIRFSLILLVTVICIAGNLYIAHSQPTFPPLTVQEEDGTPSQIPVRILIVSNDTMTVDSTDSTIVHVETGPGSGGSGETNTASNVGTGNQVFKEKNAVDLRFRTFVSGDGVVFETTDNTIFASADLVTSGSDADSSTSQSDSGLEFVSGQLTMLRGCGDNEILKWDETQDDWNCEADGGGSSGAFSDAGDPVVLNTSTKDVNIGGSTNLAKLAVDGDADQIQFLVQGNGTQTSALATFENSTGTDHFRIDGDGQIGIGAGVSTTDGILHIDNDTGDTSVILEKDDTQTAQFLFDNAGTQSAEVSYTSAEELRIANLAQDMDIRFRVNDGGSTNTIILMDADTSTMDFPTYDCSGNTNGGVLTVDASGNLVCEDDDSGAGSGDEVTVNSTTVDTTANMLDNIYVDWALTDGGAGGPDDVTAKFNYNAATGDHALSANEGAFAANGFVFEGATADTIETYIAIPDPASTDKTITFFNATDTVVGKATTDTFTNKTITDSSNNISATRLTSGTVPVARVGANHIDAASEIADDIIDFAEIKQNNTLAGNPALAVDECFFIATATGGGFICEGSTADTSEQIYKFPDVNGADTTNFIAVDDTQITNLEGTGLTVSAGALTADLGTDIDLTSEVTGTLPVANGGTGATTLTDGGILLGSGTGAVTALGVATNGQIPIGDGTTDPQLATITGTANEIDVTNGSGSITLDISDVVNLSGKTSLEVPNAADPTTDAFGEIAADNDAWAASRGALEHFDGTASTFVVATLASDAPSNGQVPKWNTGGTITWEADSTGSGSLGTNLSSTTDDILSDNGTILLGGTGNTNNETLDFDFETTANIIALSTTSGVTRIDTGSIELESDVIYLKEKASADGDTAALGQIWVKNDAPNTLYFTSDSGEDLNISEIEVQMIVFDFTTDTATGDGKFYFHIGNKIGSSNLVGVHAEVITAGTTNTTDIQIHNVDNALDMLSTKLTIDSTETGSDTAATAAVINASNDHVDENDVIRVDVDQVSTTAAKGLIVTMEFTRR